MPEAREPHYWPAGPETRAEQALAQLRPEQKRDVLLAALRTLKDAPAQEARDPLLLLYEYFATKGPKRDPGTYMRRAILDALRPIALPADVPLLLAGVATYEFLPPGFKEDAVLLRSGALLILNELDDTLASYHAARIMSDGYADPMSGEPAVTAARVLASQGALLPLYLYAMQRDAATLPEVVSECLHSLTEIPAALIAGIVERHGKSESSAVRIGLYELLIGHRAGPQALDFLADALAKARDMDVYRYLVIAMQAARHKSLADLVLRAAGFENDAARVEVLLEALQPFAADPQVAESLDRLRERQEVGRKVRR